MASWRNTSVADGQAFENELIQVTKYKKIIGQTEIKQDGSLALYSLFWGFYQLLILTSSICFGRHKGLVHMYVFWLCLLVIYCCLGDTVA